MDFKSVKRNTSLNMEDGTGSPLLARTLSRGDSPLKSRVLSDGMESAVRRSPELRFRATSPSVAAKSAVHESEDDFKMRVAVEDNIKEKIRGLMKCREGLQLACEEANEVYNCRENLKSELYKYVKYVKEKERVSSQDMQEVKIALENLTTNRKFQEHDSKQRVQHLQQEIKTLTTQKKRYEKEQKEIEKLLEEVQQKIEGLHEGKLKSFKKLLAPLEEASRTVNNQKKMIEERYYFSLEALRGTREQTLMIREELNSKLMQRAEQIGKREELDELYDDFVEKYGEELAYYVESRESDKKLEDIKEEKTVAMKDLKTTQEDLKATKENIQSTEGKIAGLHNEITRLEENLKATSEDQLAEVEKLEAFIRLKLEEVEAPDLDQILLDVGTDSGMNINKEVLKRQIELVEQEELQLLVEWSSREAQYKEAIQDITDRISEANQQSPEREGTFLRATQLRLETDLAELEALKEQYSLEQMAHRDRQKSINEWKLEARTLICQDKFELEGILGANRYDDDDGYDDELEGKSRLAQILKKYNGYSTLVLAKIRDVVHECLEDKSEIRTFESVLNVYNQKVATREEAIAEVDKQLNIAREEYESQRDELKKLTKKKEDLQNERITLKNKTSKLTAKDKLIRSESEKRRFELKEKMAKSDEERFAEYLKKYDDVFTDVKKTYGKKILQKMKEDHRKEFDALNQSRQEGRRAQIEDIYQRVDYYETVVSKNMDYVDHFLLPRLKISSEELTRNKGEYDSWNQQMSALLEAETEINKQMEDLLESKKREIWSSLHKICKERGSEVSEQRLFDLKDLVTQHITEVEQLKSDLSEVQEELVRETAEFDMQETEYTAKKEVLTKSLRGIQLEHKPSILAIEKEIKAYDTRVHDAKTKIEKFQDKYRKAFQDLELSKEALADRFDYVEEKGENTAGSPLKLLMNELRMEGVDASKSAKAAANKTPTAKFLGEDGTVALQLDEGEGFGHEEIDEIEQYINQFKSEDAAGNNEGGTATLSSRKLSPQKSRTNPQNSLKKTLQQRMVNLSFQFDTDGCSQAEVQFFDCILPLLEGTDLYRKFSDRNSLKSPSFDPFNAESNPPDSCGFGLRGYKLGKSLMRVECRHHEKPGVESSILIDHIMKPIVPKTTMELVKLQRMFDPDKLSDLTPEQQKQKTLEIIKNMSWKVSPGVVAKNFDYYKKMFMECRFYPFSIALEKGGRVELIAGSYIIFKHWIDGLNQLVKFKKQLSRLKFKIEAVQEQ